MKRLTVLVAIFASLYPNLFAQRDTLHILSWNIYMLPKLAPHTGRVARAHAIAEVLSSKDIDILLFEEAFHPGARKAIEKKLNHLYPYRYGPANPRTAFRANSGLWVLSKIPLLELGTIEYSDKNTFDAFTRKGAMLLEGNWNGYSFQLLGTHLQADNYPHTREKQLLQMRDSLLLKHQRTGVPQFVAGDLNVDRYHLPTYHRMLEILCADDACFAPLPAYSWDGVENHLARKIEKGTRQWLDYILIRNHNSKFRHLNQELFVVKGNWKKKHSLLSDHYGVLMHLVF